MKKTALSLQLLLASGLLAACATQPPAPVTSGLGDVYQGRDIPPRAITGAESVDLTGTSAQHQQLVHVVQRGDSLWDIAQKYQVTVAELQDANGLSSGQIRVGQRLKIPAAGVPLANSSANHSGGALLLQHHKPAATHKPSSRTSSSDDADSATTVSYKFHRVRSGENLFRIGLKYHVSPLDIMASNDLDKPEALMAGSVIKIPVITHTASGPSGPTEVKQINEKLARQRGFVWPAEGKVISTFGRQTDGIFNNGIQIQLAENAPIHAVADGDVIYADNGLKDYGNLILLRHKNGLITAYAHSSKMLVKKGDKAVKGQVIALAGMTGNVRKSILHFEVRRNARAIDPQKVLPR